MLVVYIKKAWSYFKAAHMTGAVGIIVATIALPHLSFFSVMELNLHCYCGIPLFIGLVMQLVLGVSLALLDYSGSKGKIKDYVKHIHKVPVYAMVDHGLIALVLVHTAIALWHLPLHG